MPVDPRAVDASLVRSTDPGAAPEPATRWRQRWPPNAYTVSRHCVPTTGTSTVIGG